MIGRVRSSLARRIVLPPLVPYNLSPPIPSPFRLFSRVVYGVKLFDDAPERVDDEVDELLENKIFINPIRRLRHPRPLKPVRNLIDEVLLSPQEEHGDLSDEITPAVSQRSVVFLIPSI